MFVVVYEYFFRAGCGSFPTKEKKDTPVGAALISIIVVSILIVLGFLYCLIKQRRSEKAEERATELLLNSQ